MKSGMLPPEVLATFKHQNQTVEENLTYDSFTGRETTPRLLQDLAREQHFLCPYTMISLGSPPNLDAHVEHIVPQARTRDHPRPGPDLDHRNMLACHPRRGNPGFGAAFRGNNELPVTPIQPDCEGRFRFDQQGRVAPSGEQDPDALTTIRILNLNHEALVDQRMAVILEWGLSPLAEEPLPMAQIRERMRTWRAPDGEGRLTPFCIALQHAAEDCLVRPDWP